MQARTPTVWRTTATMAPIALVALVVLPGFASAGPDDLDIHEVIPDVAGVSPVSQGVYAVVTTPQTGAGRICSLLPTSPSQAYTIIVTGLVAYNYIAARVGDAFYTNIAISVPAAYGINPPHGFLIDGAKPLGPPGYSVTHTYVFPMIGTGAPMCFSFGDSFYGDNLGVLIVAMVPPV
jgi:hypothetical protein